MIKGVFVTGTDTGVGKTVITASLGLALKRRGIDVAVMKPVESGCTKKGDHLIPNDALFLKETLGSDESLDLINPCRFENPVAPSLASRLEGIKIRKEKIKKSYLELASRHEITIVEGIGGLLVPLYGKFMVADLVRFLDIPIIVVARSSLGTINHTLLTVNQAQNSGLALLGIIINHTSETLGLAERNAAALLKKLLPVPILGTFPYVTSFGKEDNKVIPEIAEENLKISRILRRLKE